MLNVLVAEDEWWIRRALVEMVENMDAGFHVAGEAANGDEAWELIWELWPNVLITDIMMPGKDGLDLMKDIDAMALPIVPIVISGHSNFQYAQQAIRYGVSEYLLKPVLESELKEALLRSMGKLETKRELHGSIAEIQQLLHDLPSLEQAEMLRQYTELIDRILQLPHPGTSVGLLRIFATKFIELLEGAEAGAGRALEPFPEFRGPEAVRHYFQQLLEQWLRLAPKGGTHFVVKKVCDYISEHYMDEIRIVDMALFANISCSYLSSLFKQHTGLTFVHYVNQVKIDKAKQLLFDPGKKVYEVADEVGFASLPYFNRVFKNTTGASPNEFRRNIGL
jgi:two-component system response regulator YesN